MPIAGSALLAKAVELRATYFSLFLMPIEKYRVCGIQELPGHASTGVTHVLSLLDPEYLELDIFNTYGEHHRVEYRFHDIIEPIPGYILPRHEDMAAILALGREIKLQHGTAAHFLVHCHQGVSRSTAVLTAILADEDADQDEDAIFTRLREIRPQAWPNSLMIQYADEILSRKGRLVSALSRHYAHQLVNQPDYKRWMISLGREKEVQMGLDAMDRRLP